MTSHWLNNVSWNGLQEQCVLCEPWWQGPYKTILKHGLFWKLSVCSAVTKPSSFTNTQTHRSIQDTTHGPLAHMPCGPALCLLLHAFKVPRPLALCKAALGHSELVYAYAFFGVSVHQRTLKDMKICLQKITHLGGRLFFFRVLTSLLSAGSTVCSCILGTIK